MNSHNLQLMLQAQAIMIRVEGMKAENQTRAANGDAAAYGEEHFQAESDTMGFIMQDVSHE